MYLLGYQEVTSKPSLAKCQSSTNGTHESIHPHLTLQRTFTAGAHEFPKDTTGRLWIQPELGAKFNSFTCELSVPE